VEAAEAEKADAGREAPGTLGLGRAGLLRIATGDPPGQLGIVELLHAVTVARPGTPGGVATGVPVTGVLP
jgi:hypothetical protein